LIHQFLGKPKAGLLWVCLFLHPPPTGGSTMRILLQVLCCSFGLFALGCGDKPELRSEPAEYKGKVKFASGISPKDLTITFQPQQNAHPGGAKLAEDGSFTVKVAPGKYSYYFDAEANAKVPAFKKIAKTYHSPTTDHSVSFDGSGEITVEVQ